MPYYGHPDFDAPEFHLADRPLGPAPRRMTREQLRARETALLEIDANVGHVAPERLARRAALLPASGSGEAFLHARGEPFRIGSPRVLPIRERP